MAVAEHLQNMQHRAVVSHFGRDFVIGNALYEEQVYDGSGAPLATTFLDYHLPRASDVPRIEVYHQECPSPLNELGVKGCGEGGTVAVPAAITNAVEDALRPLELKIMEMPLQPEKLLQAIDEAEARAAE